MGIFWISRSRSLSWDQASALWVRLQKMRVIGSSLFTTVLLQNESLVMWGKQEYWLLSVWRWPLDLWGFYVHFCSAKNLEFPRGKDRCSLHPPPFLGIIVLLLKNKYKFYAFEKWLYTPHNSMYYHMTSFIFIKNPFEIGPRLLGTKEKTCSHF